ncbi:hypothetical protein PTSG_07663 [Salpingoeca rosetta]|uniref:PDZ domain-containing protein n=1 Tax=Salpingoeca rosetta (strain ATCC 50818 / BSB-021) TaxID=946362 RepID=F2UHE9_SALR5|nr:uncharacterized protein PTSG_07663 [Salpingoeca rosetta]EGD76548.1 hypothetical protein PTSG_07663 [Salpingoeca rosetta]|eukprot:XP_004991462.1 hypothetical protein PTSG_07663 [Salpingoeca rosetta]
MSGWPEEQRVRPNRAGSLPRRSAREGVRHTDSPLMRSTGSDSNYNPRRSPQQYPGVGGGGHHQHPHHHGHPQQPVPPPPGAGYRPQSGTTQSSFSMSDDWLYQLEDRITQTASSQGQLKGEFVMIQGRVQILEQQLASERERSRRLEQELHSFRSEMHRFQQNVHGDFSTLRETLVFYKNILSRHEIHFDLPPAIAKRLDYMNPLSRMGAHLHREDRQGVEVMSWVKDVQRQMPRMQQFQLTLHPHPEDPSRYELELTSDGMGHLVVNKLSQGLYDDGLRKGDILRFVEGAELSHATVPAAVALFRRRSEGTRVGVEREMPQQPQQHQDQSRPDSRTGAASHIGTSVQVEGSVQATTTVPSVQSPSRVPAATRPRVGSFASSDSPYESSSTIRGFRAPAIRYESETDDAEPDNNSDDENRATYHAYMAQQRPQQEGGQAGQSAPSPQNNPSQAATASGSNMADTSRQASSASLASQHTLSGSTQLTMPPPPYHQPQQQQQQQQGQHAPPQHVSHQQPSPQGGQQAESNNDVFAPPAAPLVEEHQVSFQRLNPNSLGFGVRGVCDNDGQNCQLFVGSLSDGSPAQRHGNFMYMKEKLKATGHTSILVISRKQSQAKLMRALSKHRQKEEEKRLALDALATLRERHENLLFQLCTLTRDAPDQPLGLTLGETTQLGVVVQSVKEGGLAAKAQQVHVGDVLVNVNGWSLAGLARSDARKKLREASEVLHLVHARPKKRSQPNTDL